MSCCRGGRILFRSQLETSVKFQLLTHQLNTLMKRRKFIGLIGLGSAISSIVSSCLPKQSQPLTNSVRADGFQEVGTLTELAKNEQLFKQNLGEGDTKALVIRNPKNNNQLIAVNPTCPHAGCTVAWESEEGVFVCPCHHSQFSSDGEVLEGPATESLISYPIRQEGNLILVKIS